MRLVVDVLVLFYAGAVVSDIYVGRKGRQILTNSYLLSLKSKRI